jgi:hypothetical protein
MKNESGNKTVNLGIHIKLVQEPSGNQPAIDPNSAVPNL